MEFLNFNIFDYTILLSGIFLFLHGFVYFNLSRGSFDNSHTSIDSSLLFTKLMNKQDNIVITKILWSLTGLGFIGIGIYMIITQQLIGITVYILIITSIIGIISFLVYWDGVRTNLFAAGALGAVIDVIVLVGTLLM